MSVIKKPSIDLMMASLGGLSTWLSQAWLEYSESNEKLNVDITRSIDDARAVMRGSPDQKIRYPYCIGVLVNIESDTSRGSYSRKRMDVVTNRDKDLVQIENLIPVRLGLMLNFRSTSMNEVLKFAHLLILNAPRVSLKLSDEASDFIYECGIELDGNLSIPSADMSHPDKQFSFETTAILTSYTGTIRNGSLIKNVVMSFSNKINPSSSQIKIGDLSNLEDIASSRVHYLDLFDTNSPNYRKD
jgi:hypothetical protein